MDVFLRNKTIFLYFGISAFLALILFGILILRFFAPQQPSQQNIRQLPTPTRYTEENYNRAPDGSFRFTPYQKTEIDKTTDEQVRKTQTVLSQTTKNGVTIYKVRALSPLTPDEIRTQRGVVVFEKNKTLLDNKYGPLPRLPIYTQEFGQAESTKDNISPYGAEVTAYMYASKGFTLFANRYTKEVYEVQRFTPMSVEQYKSQYREFLVSIPTERLQ